MPGQESHLVILLSDFELFCKQNFCTIFFQIYVFPLNFTLANKKLFMTKGFYNKTFIIAGHACFMILLLLSVFYYKERIAFFDNVFYLFKIVNFGKINIEAGRYGAFLSQLPLLAGLKLHLSLKNLMLIYSISFILIYYLVYIICVHPLNNLAAGLSIVFIMLLCIKQSFYHPTQESHQGLVYSALLFAVIQYPFRPNIFYVKYLIGGLIIALCFYTHPITFFVLLFILGYHIVWSSNWKEYGIYFLAFLMVALSLIKLYHTKSSSYEGNFISSMVGSGSPITDFFNFCSVRFFAKRIPSLYFWLLVLTFILFIYLILRKEYRKTAYLMVSSAGFLLIILLTYSKGDSNVMMERGFLPLCLFISIPFFNELLVINKKNLLLVFSIFVIIVLAGVRRLNNEGKLFQSRIAYLDQLIEKTNDYQGGKFLLKRSEEISSNIIIPWNFPFTIMVLSAMKGKDHTKTIFLYDDLKDWEKYLTGNPDKFLGADFCLNWKTAILNPHYFKLPDGPYQVLK
jgi:hypothetical protein